MKPVWIVDDDRSIRWVLEKTLSREQIPFKSFAWAIDESSHQRGAREEVGLTPEILGQAPAMQEVFRAIGRLSQSHATVMITGESGTGKELVARALHRHSLRAAGP